MAVTYGTSSMPALLPEAPALPKRDVWRSIGRGMLGRCPNCGKGAIFSRFISVNAECSACGEEFHHHRADDFPPYLTIAIVGHIIVPAMMIVERSYQPAIWVHMALWLPLTIILSLILLPILKGGIIGMQWALQMHGFDKTRGEDQPTPDPAGGLRS